MSFGISLKEIIENTPSVNIDSIIKRGPVLIVAPHTDDESLACGGIISLMTGLQKEVHVLFISDGSMSHPQSKKYPPNTLAKLREKEALEALNILNVPTENAIFLRVKDAHVPMPVNTDFKDTIVSIEKLLNTIYPKTIILPWRRDPHNDHRASWHLVNAAVQKAAINTALLEYPLWLRERGADNDLPVKGEVSFYKINIASVLEKKLQAIAAHRSQVTKLIDDDPGGFILSSEMLSHFNTPFEFFFGNPDN